jgi:hypothetical protein
MLDEASGKMLTLEDILRLPIMERESLSLIGQLDHLPTSELKILAEQYISIYGPSIIGKLPTSLVEKLNI